MKKIFFILFCVLVFTSCKKDNIDLIEYVVYCEVVPFGIQYDNAAGDEMNVISYEKDWSIGFIYTVDNEYIPITLHVYDVVGGDPASSSNVCRLQIKHKNQIVAENTTLVTWYIHEFLYYYLD